MTENMEFMLAVPPAPLKGDLYVADQARRLLGDAFIHQVYDALRYDDPDVRIFNAQGRNYYIPLPEALGPYDALQVSGGGNFDLGIRSNAEVKGGLLSVDISSRGLVIEPPSETSGQFVGRTVYYEGRRCLEERSVNPVGSYTESSAGQKITSTQEATARLGEKTWTVLTPRYMGRFEYELSDHEGGRQTAILMLVPSMGRRLDADLVLPMRVFEAGRELPSGLSAAEVLGLFYDNEFSPRLDSIGAGIAETHKAGMVHNQLTAGNTDAIPLAADVYLPYITDWGTMKMPVASDAMSARALDIFIAVKSAASVIGKLALDGTIDEQTASAYMLLTAVSLLQGYHGQFKDTGRQRRLDARQAVIVASGELAAQEAIAIVEAWLP